MRKKEAERCKSYTKGWVAPSGGESRCDAVGTVTAINERGSTFATGMGSHATMDRRAVMSQQHLGTYLNDHLAGSVTALELLEYLEKEQSGRILGHNLAGLRADIAEDRAHLEALMKQSGVSASLVRRAVAWLGE